MADSLPIARPSATPPELCDSAGAVLLKQRIESYWKAKGHEVRVVIVATGFTNVMRSARFDIRSTLVNGLPPALKEHG